MTWRKTLRKAESFLRESGIEEFKTDAWLLMTYATGMDRTHYFLVQEEEFSEDADKTYRELLKKRAAHVPLQYLTGTQEFMGLSFEVNSHVLIPRQDTELLVLETERCINPGDNVLDLCTGSGCVAISLAKRRKIQATASDISEEALETARRNAELLGADVCFVKSDLFEHISGKYDCIVSNPPYIRREEIAGLMPEVRDYEPLTALDGHEDGLHFYREIIRHGGAFLKSGGWLLFEIGCDQGQAVAELLKEAGFDEIEIKKDLAGLDRVAVGRWN
ncbi:MAG: peptide chain release factor N(5)-glutamine methyltransferase [Eubacteriales bacterium]|nr:peptide chain release factor N(5)-glutamine methyltransferase [Eubacteriales bacterium]